MEGLKLIPSLDPGEHPSHPTPPPYPTPTPLLCPGVALGALCSSGIQYTLSCLFKWARWGEICPKESSPTHGVGVVARCLCLVAGR